MISISSTKKIVVLCLCILLVGGAWVPLVTTDRENSTAEADPAWGVSTTGTRSEPILIRNMDDLQNMKNDLSADYALANDIDASVTKEWNSGAGFEPVGPDRDNQFTGSFDGRNFTITGLYINRSSTNYVGLFGWIGSGGSVSNVGMENVDITGKNRVGGLVGRNYASVSNCYATGNVSGNDAIGGLVGDNWGSVENCSATGSVSGGYWVAGLVGGNSGLGASVSNCYATGSVSGNKRVGGLVGRNQGSMENCFRDTETSGRTTNSGGTGKTTAEMKAQSTFTEADWDFEDVWCMCKNVTYEHVREMGNGDSTLPYMNEKPGFSFESG